jgi:multiple sugar transport system permease protein
MEVKRNQWEAWIYLAPTLILMAVFTVYPLFNTFFIAFAEDYNYMLNDWDGLGFGNFATVLQKKSILQYFKTTVLITVISVPISIILSLLIAVGLNSIKKFQKVYQTIFFMPYVTNAIAIGMVFSVIFNSRYGIFNSLIENLGFEPINWLGGNMPNGDLPSYSKSLIVLLVYIIWNALPFKIMILLSGLQGIDKQYYQAAQIDCASKFRVLTKITLPLLSPQVTFLTTTSIIGSFKEYSSIIGVFGDAEGPIGQKNSMSTIVSYIYKCIAKNDIGIAAAAAVMLFVIIMIFTFFKEIASKKRVHY